ncbi:MAG: c-type cytochrome [Methylophilaceae bacterium]|nr:c-type cytochrome [Methylophilaceae bacterium]
MLSNKSVKSTMLVTMLTLAGLALPLQASAECKLVSTKDNSPLSVKAAEGDTAEAKTFLETCINPYTQAYAKDPALILEKKAGGKKLYGYNGCSGCHGGKLEGVMAPSLSKRGGQGAFDTKWVYAKNSTDKGMFETISAGTPGVSGGIMPTWHKQVEGHAGDGLSTDEILKIIAYIRSGYGGDGDKDWLKDEPQK